MSDFGKPPTRFSPAKADMHSAIVKFDAMGESCLFIGL